MENYINAMNSAMRRFTGRRQIRINCTKQDLNTKVIAQNLNDILAVHVMNVSEYAFLDDFTKGNQDIFLKKRPYNDTTNNIVVENHALSMVRFKQGYMFGENVEYTQRESSDCTEELSQFNTYINDISKEALDSDIGYPIYVGGQGFRLILPKSSSEIEDISKESPFEVFNVSNYTTFVVYSSNYTKEKLFGGVIVQESGAKDKRYLCYIYTDTQIHIYRVDKGGNGYNVGAFVSTVENPVGYCPIIEYYTNEQRIGLVETVYTILNAINLLASNSLDNVDDFVNSILALYNINITEGTLDTVKEQGVISLKTSNPNTPADAKYLTNKLDLSAIKMYSDALVAVAYDIVGVPRSSVQFTSGGDTGQARLLGGGWSKADSVAAFEEKDLIKSEKELIKIALSICRKMPDCSIKELFSSDLDIKFTRNNSDNLLVKVQSLKQLFDMNMPFEQALNIVNLTSNNHELSVMWQKWETERTQQNKETNSEIKEN